MKYLVIVNRGRYIVTVDALSAGGAEHKVLDPFEGVREAQAFTLEEAGGDTFRWLARDAETVSLQELGNISRTRASLWDAASDASQEHADAWERIEALRAQLAEAIEAEHAAAEAVNRAEARALKYDADALGLDALAQPWEIENPRTVRDWLELDTGRLYTRAERDALLVDKYGFEEGWGGTPASEIWEHFDRLRGTSLEEIPGYLQNEYPDAVREYLAQF